MEQALIDPQKTFPEIMAPLTRSQRLNITFLLCGYSPREAREKASVKQHQVEDWLIEPTFTAIRDFVVANKEKYKNDALALWAQDLAIEGRRLIQKLIDKIDSWEELSREDKMYVWRAVELLGRLAPEIKVPTKEGSYDEWVIRRHRALHE